MVKFVAQRVRNIRFAVAGLLAALHEEINVWFEFTGMGVCISAAWLAGVPGWGIAALCAIAASVVPFELLNSAIERLADIVQPNEDPRVKTLKDFASAAVFVPVVFFVALWLFLLTSAIFKHIIPPQ